MFYFLQRVLPGANATVYDVSTKKPNISRFKYGLGDGYSTFIAPYTVKRGKSANTFSYEAWFIER